MIFNKLYSAILAGLALALLIMPALKVNSLHATIWDLGVYSNLFWSLEQGQWQRLFFGHATPLLGLYFPAYSGLVSIPITLVSLQALTILIGVFFCLAQDKLLSLPGRLTTLAFLVFFPVWYNALFDFHPDHLVIPLGFAFFYYCRREQWAKAVFFGCAMALVKEIYALSAVGCGVYLLIKGGGFRAGLTCIFFGLIYFLLVVYVIIPQFTYPDALYGKIYQVDRLGGFLDVNLLFSNPIGWFRIHLLDPPRIKFLVFLIGVLAFVPLLAPIELLPALPILAVLFLYGPPNYYGLGHHYTAGFVAPLLISFSNGLPKLLRYYNKITAKSVLQRLHRPEIILFGLGVFLVIANGLISPAPLSRLFWTNKVWFYGHQAYLPGERERMIKRLLAQHVPSDPKLTISAQNTLFNHQVSSRTTFAAFPVGLDKKAPFPDYELAGMIRYFLADYFVLDLKRPWYIDSLGCAVKTESELRLTGDELNRLGLEHDPGALPWSGCLSQTDRRRFITAAAKASAISRKLCEEDGFVIYKRMVGK